MDAPASGPPPDPASEDPTTSPPIDATAAIDATAPADTPPAPSAAIDASATPAPPAPIPAAPPAPAPFPGYAPGARPPYPPAGAWPPGYPPQPPYGYPYGYDPGYPPPGYPVQPGYGPPRRQERRGPRTSVVLAAVALVAILAGGALFMSGYSLGQRTALQPGSPLADGEVNFQPFWDAYRAIDGRYAGGELDRKALIEGAIDGMFEAIGDPYSAYMTSEQYQASLQGISGEFEGIGAEISTRSPDGTTGTCSPLGPECQLIVVAPIEGSPAEGAGLQPGDAILAVDGATLDGLTVDGARDKVRGKKGTEVVLTIQRGEAEPFDVTIVRDVVVRREVTARELAGGEIGYIRVSGFSDHAADDFMTALQEHLDAGRTKLVLDIRSNPGGFTTATRRIASQFIGSGPIFWEQDAAGTQVAREADPDGIATDPAIELVVLVDRGSASASEILAGALQDTGRATIVGQTTFGKGTVQQWTALDDDYGGYRLTIARWLTPDKHWIHGTGVEPDVTVEVPDDQAPDEDAVIDAGLEVLGAGGSAALLRAAA